MPAHQARQLDAIGISRGEVSLRLRDWRESVLPQRKPEVIVLHPGSGDPKKNLPPSAWADVIDRVRRETGVPVRIVLGPAEKERDSARGLDRVADAVETSESVAELLKILAGARLFVGNDSGATHLAAALGIPTLAVFGPSDSKLWRPLGPRVRVVASRQPCAPCTAGGPIRCDSPSCLHEMETREVADAAVQLLAG